MTLPPEADVKHAVQLQAQVDHHDQYYRQVGGADVFADTDTQRDCNTGNDHR